MNIQPETIFAATTALLVGIFLFFVRRMFAKFDDHDMRLKHVELRLEGHYDGDGVEDAIERQLEPLKESLREHRSDVKQIHSIVLKLAAQRGVN